MPKRSGALRTYRYPEQPKRRGIDVRGVVFLIGCALVLLIGVGSGWGAGLGATVILAIYTGILYLEGK